MSNNVKISMDRVYRTRDGQEVRIYAVDGGGKYPIHGAIKVDEENFWAMGSWKKTGKYAVEFETKEDLIEVKPRHKRTVWINLYPNGKSSAWEDKRDADILRGSGAIACIKVELDFEEGEGL